MKPLGDYLAVIPKPPKGKTDGGIIIPGKGYDNNIIEAVVAEVGDGVDGLRNQVNKKDVILMNINSGIPFEVDGVLYKLIRQSHVIATL
jgi:co-chaperonin GroES (HSP10)